MEKYSKFQFGWTIVILFLAFIFLWIAAYIFHWGNNPLDKYSFVSFLVLIIGILLNFFGMTVCVNEKHVIIRFGIGFFKKKIDLTSITSTEIKVYPVYYGYGIRIIPNGVLFNVHGNHCIELKIRKKKTVIQIGSNDWENLKSAIDFYRQNNNKCEIPQVDLNGI